MAPAPFTPTMKCVLTLLLLLAVVAPAVVTPAASVPAGVPAKSVHAVTPEEAEGADKPADAVPTAAPAGADTWSQCKHCPCCEDRRERCEERCTLIPRPRCRDQCNYRFHCCARSIPGGCGFPVHRPPLHC